jgi:hypothetical protein
MLVARVQKLVRLAKTMTPTGYTIYNPFENWVHEGGKVVLVGEAAHPLMVRQPCDYTCRTIDHVGLRSPTDRIMQLCR